MVKSNLIFLVLAFLFVTSACRKKELVFTFSGAVSDLTFGGGLNGVKVNVFVRPLGEGERLVTSAHVNSDGSYSVEIPRDRIEFVRLSFEKHNYFEFDQQLSFSQLTVNQDNEVDAGLTAKSWVKFEIKNQPPANASDEFKLLKYRGKTNCPECCANEFFFFYGPTNEDVVCANDANTYVSYYYWVVGTQNNGQDSILTVPFDTVVRTFVY